MSKFLDKKMCISFGTVWEFIMNKIYTMDYSTITAPTEGTVTKRIEKITAKLPSDSFLFAAGGIILLSLATRAMGKEHTSLFLGNGLLLYCYWEFTIR